MSGFKFSGEKTKGNSITRITGLGAVKLVAVNPSNKEYTELTGEELPYELKYEKKSSPYADKTQPINFLVYQKDYDSYFFANFELADKKVSTADGAKFKWIDKKGNITYFAANIDIPLNNPKMKWANYHKDSMRPLNVGEEALYSFMMAFANVTSSADSSNFIEIMEANNCSFKELYAGKLNGLKEFVNNYKEDFVALPFVVRKKTVSNEDGTESVKFYQELYVSNPDLFYHTTSGVVDDYLETKFENAITKEKERSGRELINNRLYTVKLQSFNETSCLGAIPAVPVKNGDDDLPF